MNAREQSSISAAVAGDTAIGSGWVGMEDSTSVGSSRRSWSASAEVTLTRAVVEVSVP